MVRMKTYDLGVIIGRFQHLHRGHELMIDTALNSCEKVLLLVGSSQESGTVRNPFTLYTRMNLIRERYEGQIANEQLLLGHIDDMTNENDHSTEWGDFVLNKINMWRGHYGIKEEFDCLITGKEEDRMLWFDPLKVENVGQIIIPKNKFLISATEIRYYLARGDFDNWEDNMILFDDSYELFKELREELLQIPFYKNIDKEDITNG
jgi:bifunctional NMN adenylyltransferase/nudix hydrolase